MIVGEPNRATARGGDTSTHGAHILRFHVFVQQRVRVHVLQADADLPREIERAGETSREVGAFRDMRRELSAVDKLRALRKGERRGDRFSSYGARHVESRSLVPAETRT